MDKSPQFLGLAVRHALFQPAPRIDEAQSG